MKIAELYKMIVGKIFKKEDIVQNVEQTYKELDNFVIPAAIEMAKTFSSFEVKDANVVRFQNDLQRALDNRRLNIFSLLNINAVNAHTLANELEKMVEKNFNDITNDASLSFVKANVLQLVGYLDFYSRYIQKLFNYILNAENTQVDPNDTIQNSLSKGEIDFIERNWLFFLSIAKLLGTKADVIVNLINKIPDAEITVDNADLAEKVATTNKVDPLRLGLVPPRNLVTFHIGMYFVKRQVRKYSEAKAQHEQILLRIKKLKRDYDNDPNPVLADRIEFLGNRINQLSAEIAEMEKGYV